MTNQFINRNSLTRGSFMLLVILISSCKSNHERLGDAFYSFHKIDSVIVKTGYPNVPWASTAIAHLRISGVDYLYTTDIDNRKILRINLNAHKNDQEINLNFLQRDKYPVFSIHVFNQNNILLLRDITNFRADNDSAFYLLDSIGNIKTRFTGYQAPFPDQHEPIKPLSITLKHAFLPLFSYRKSLFFRPPTYYSTITNRQRDSAFIPEIIRFDSLHAGKHAFSVSPFKNPQLFDGLFSTQQRTMYLLPINSAELIVGYSNNPVLYKVLFTTGEVLDSSPGNSKILLQKPTPLASKEDDRSGNNRKSSKFTSLLHDSTNQQIIRFAYLGANNDLTTGEYQDFLKNQWFGIYDEDLNFLGQGFKPKWFAANWPRPINIDGIWYTVKTNPENNYYITIYKSRLIKIDTVNAGQFSNKLSSISNTRSNKEIDKYPLMDKIKNESIVLLVPENSCPACINAVTQYYVENIDSMEQNKIYFLSNSAQAIQLLGDRHSEFIILDSKKNLADYLNSSVSNPMLFYWKDKKIEKSILLNPNEAQNLQHYLKILEKQKDN